MVVPLQKVGSYVLRTRPPLITIKQASLHSYDLHVLSMPPAFILSQDQTLREIFLFFTVTNVLWMSKNVNPVCLSFKQLSE